MFVATEFPLSIHSFRGFNTMLTWCRYNISLRSIPTMFHLAACLVLLSKFASGEVFTNSFLVRLHGEPGNEVANQIASRNGFENVGPILKSKSEFHFVHRALPHARSKRSIQHMRKLKVDPLVHQAVQQSGFKRVKRGYKPLKVENLVPDIVMKESQDPSDPYFPFQWYLKNTGQNGGKAKLDLNVEAAWAQGVTGRNITTAIMDDGVDYMHMDLKNNYNAKASYDFSSNDPYPYPRYTDDWFNSHGTRCAGEVAAARDNGVCGVGVAYDSKIAGIRMLDQPYMTDLIEANSMGHEPNLIDIYSASWGPTDDGKTVDGPRNATMRAIVRGVNEGRNGLGNIYVWASGDGGEDDDCNCDGYAASMWTISINSAINDGQNAHYDESCSSTLATPEAAGVFALALEANPQLTWRDIQHLTVLTSKRNSLFDAKGRFHWTMNGVGLEFNHLFGFGVLDAGAMVALAKQWKTVPARYHCEAGSVKQVTSMILSKRINDNDRRDGFTKWPFMTTHTWGEYPQGTWLLEISFNSQEPNHGFIKEWTLMIHGTRDPPYSSLPVSDPHSKLAIVKKAHQDRLKMK
ncbi:hypothetical protein M8J75_010444 [Diaphorina citri]|nr:hypothetical protein M8J75_010444 [Diaphorina citri]